MKHSRVDALSLILTVMMLASTIAVFRAHAATIPWYGYVKPAYPDYAPSGMPDFDEKQDNWGPSPGTYTWCGPVAVANSFWWLDSEYESLLGPNPVPPPTISDNFSLVSAYVAGAWDDHSPMNVDPLVRDLAALMDTDGQTSHDGHIGTRWADLESGIKQYLMNHGVTNLFEVHNSSFPTFTWIDTETEKCQDVELFLEFWQWTGSTWLPLTGNETLMAGHIVTVAGANSTVNPGEVLISDPLQDAFEAGTAPRGGREPLVHPVHGPLLHNDAQYVSQDGYQVKQWTPPPIGPYGAAQNVSELVGYLQTLGYGPNWHTFIRAAVATSPREVPEWPGYIKPEFPDYAPSGMPDFDEKQSMFATSPGQYTWCVPVAVANSLWWLDSEYESIMFPGAVPPPTKSDHFNLVNSSTPLQWDDHDPQNVASLVITLAYLMDTDGIRTHDGHLGTRLTDVQSGIQEYLKQQKVASMFEVHNSSFPTFEWIENETEVCQDVELFLDFWQLTPQGWKNTTITNPSLELGHCVTSAGVNSTASKLLISDPYQDAYEAGKAPGRSPVAHLYPHVSAVHNDTQYVSQDEYSVGAFAFPPVPPPPPGYPSTVRELQGYLQTMGFDPSYHAFIRGAVATSPVGIHDVAVTNVTSAKTVICQGYGGNLTVTVQNQGNFTETFNVTAYANTTSIASQNVTLSSGNSTNITFTWNTTGFAKGNYTIKAVADTVPGETDTADNTLVNGWVIVSMVGDITGPNGWPDGKCDMRDVRAVAKLFGINYPDPRYDPNCDINDDGKIDMKDVRAVAKEFGKTDP